MQEVTVCINMLIHFFMFWSLVVWIPYLIGAIPTGYFFAAYFFGIDITTKGSGNIGATNISRVLGGVKYFFLILFLDASKAFGYLYFLKNKVAGGYFHFTPWHILLAATMLLIGNGYSCFLRGKGGKGVATLVGILGALAPGHFMLSMLVIWVLLFSYFRRIDSSSLLSLFLGLLVYGAFFYAQFPQFIYFLLFAFVFLSIRHHNNIKAWCSYWSTKEP